MLREQLTCLPCGLLDVFLASQKNNSIGKSHTELYVMRNNKSCFSMISNVVKQSRHDLLSITPIQIPRRLISKQYLVRTNYGLDERQSLLLPTTDRCRVFIGVITFWDVAEQKRG